MKQFYINNYENNSHTQNQKPKNEKINFQRAFRCSTVDDRIY